MTDLRKAAEMALEALEWHEEQLRQDNRQTRKAIEALRQALAQPEQAEIKQGWDVDTLLDKQEPVAWVEVHDTVNGAYEFHGMNLLPKGRHHLFTAPPSKPINFLVNGTRYKIRHQGYYGCSIVGLPEDLNGQWVALVDATDDKHLQCTAPPSKPWVSLSDERIAEIVREAAKGSAINRDGSTSHRVARAIEAASKELNHG